MNAKQRKSLIELMAKAEDIKNLIEEIKNDVEEFASEEHDKFDNMPEGLQQGEKDQAIDAAATELDEAVSSFDSAISEIESAFDSMQNATNQ